MSSPRSRNTGRVKATPFEKVDLPRRGRIHRYFVTSAQTNTPPFKAAWDNMQALAGHYGAELLVAGFTYDKKLWTLSGEVKGTSASTEEDISDRRYDYDETFRPHMRDAQMLFGKSLAFCANMNILPTAVRPLSGLELHTGRRSAIYPHAKIEMMSVASGKFEGTKLMYTTGTATKRNYLQKKAGQKAERLHCYGGLIVEITEDGCFYVRQVQANERGVLCDLDVRVEGGRVSTGNPVEAIAWGDTHGVLLDPEIRELAWGQGGMLDVLQPRHQFHHDVFDMRFRNHHERGSPQKMFERLVDQLDDGEDEAKVTSDVVKASLRDWCKTYIVKSNHDDAFERWLDHLDAWRDRDAKNLLLWLQANTARFEAAARGDKDFLPIEWLLRRHGVPGSTRFLKEDESFILCKDEEGGIEMGLHGHRGVNGTHGTLLGFSKMGRKTVTADGHSAGILDGAYRVGVSGRLDMGYNKGPSSWSHTHCVVYPTGSRALVTCWNGRWRG